MPSVYVHLSGRDVDEALLRHYGIKVEREEKLAEALAPRRCPSCARENPPSALYCGSCHAPLTAEAVAGLEERRSLADRLTAVGFGPCPPPRWTRVRLGWL